MSNAAFDSALRQGDVTLVRRLIEQGEVDVNMMVKVKKKDLLPQRGGTYTVFVPALHAATAFGRVDIVQLLIEKHANVNTRIEFSGATSALILALERSLFQVANVLLEGGADPNVTNPFDKSPLDCCCFGTGAHFIPTLLRYGARIEGSEHAQETPLQVTCQNNDLLSASILVEHGADVNARGGGGRSPIFLSYNPDIMQMLLTNGAQVNLQDKDKWTPLHWCARNDLACCKLLLSNNANIEAVTTRGSTPLHFAVMDDIIEIVCLLLAHQRSRHGRDGVASLLLRTNDIKRNVLHRAYTAETARLLVEQCRGVDGVLLAACHQLTSARDYNGETPLDNARTYRKMEKAEYLESFTTFTLATAGADAASDGCLAVMLNPKLDDFQRAIATDCLDLVCTTCLEVPDSALFAMLGYLSISDVMRR